MSATGMEMQDFAEQSEEKSRFNWRSQIVSGLLIVVIAVFAVKLFGAARQVNVLQLELTKLRGEAGHLDIVDPNKVYAVRVETHLPNEWAWRIYLPANHTYTMYNYRGFLSAAELAKSPGGAQRSPSGSGGYGKIESGEFLLRFRIESGDDGQWITKVIHRTSTSTIGMKERSNWLTDRDWDEASDIPAGQQREFSHDAVIELLRLRHESGVSSNGKDGRAETVTLWISGTSPPVGVK